MFINLSNHKSINWKDKQVVEAASISTPIHDIKFPKVPPEVDVIFIANKTKELVTYIISLNPTVVHVMGEHTLTFNIVMELKKAGIRTIASTSKRISYINEDGHKISIFDFVRFRDY